MAVRILKDADGYQVMYCSTTMTAFGPVHTEDTELEEFLEWLPKDARKYTEIDLLNIYWKWMFTKEENLFI